MEWLNPVVETDLAFPQGETIYQQYKYNEILDSNSYWSPICKFQTYVKLYILVFLFISTIFQLYLQIRNNRVSNFENISKNSNKMITIFLKFSNNLIDFSKSYKYQKYLKFYY